MLKRYRIIYGEPVTIFEAADGDWVRHADAVAACDSLQAKIDELMLEYCPDEMTTEQRAEWAKHQVAVPEAETALLAAMTSNRQ